MINDLNQNLRVIPLSIKIGDKKRPVSKHWPKAIRGSLIKIKLKIRECCRSNEESIEQLFYEDNSR